MTVVTTAVEQPLDLTPKLGTGIGTSVNPVFPTDTSTIDAHNKSLRDNSSVLDVIKASASQGWITSAAVSQFHGNQFVPQPNYSVFSEWDKNVEGLNPDDYKYMYKSTSAAQTEYLKNDILKNRRESEVLGAQGYLGQKLDLAMGFLDPVNYVPVAGQLGKGAMLGAKALTVAKAIEPLTTKVVAKYAAEGAVGNVAATAYIQKQNYRDKGDEATSELLAAGAVGAGFMAGIGAGSQLYNSHKAAKITNASIQEGAAMKAASKVGRGEELTPSEHVVIKKQAEDEKHIRDVESGRKDPVEAGRKDYTADPKPAKDAVKVADESLTREHAIPAKDVAHVDPNTPVNPSAADTTTGGGDPKTAALRSMVASDSPLALDTPDTMLSAEQRTQLAKLSDYGHPDNVVGTAKALDEHWRQNPTSHTPDTAAIHPKLSETLLAHSADPSNVAHTQTLETLLKAANPEHINTARVVHKANTMATISPHSTSEASHILQAAETKASISPDASVVGHETHWRDGLTDELHSGEIKRINDFGKYVIQNSKTGDMHTLHPHELDYEAVGYKEPPVVSGFAKDSIGSASTVDPRASSIFTQPVSLGSVKVGKYTVPLRFDDSYVVNKSGNAILQNLMGRMNKDAIGFDKYEAQGRTATEHKFTLVKTQAGNYGADLTDLHSSVVGKRKVSPMKQRASMEEFSQNVTRVRRGDTQVLLDNPDIAEELTKASSNLEKLFKTFMDLAKKAGVKGAEDVIDTGNYVTRVWDTDAIRTAHGKHGEGIYEALSGAFNSDKLRALSPIEKVTKAKTFVDTILKLEFSTAFQDLHLHAGDEKSLREALITPERGVPELAPHEIDALIDVLFEAKDAAKAAEGSDAGRTGTLKHRMNFNENYAHVMDDGSTLRFSDLLENDSRIIVDKYVNSMAGHIAAAEHMGIYSPADFAKQIREAEELHLKEGALKSDSSKFNTAKTLVEDAYATLIGRPKSIQIFSKTDRALNAMRAITRSTMLGQLGIPALFEAKNAIANTSLRAFALHSPEFTGILNSLRAGHTPTNQLVQDIQQFIGLGLETKAGYARQNSITEFTYDKKLTKFENFANDASHFTNRISGNGVITDATEVLSSMMEVQKHADWATGKVPITESQRLRMVGQGVSYDDLDDVLAQLKNHTEFHESGAVKSIDYEKWKETSPQTHDAYQTMLTREVSDVIQRAFEGEKWAWAGTPIGKVFTELKTFMLVGHAKQFLKNVHYNDATAHGMWMLGIIGAALEYSLAQALNYAHDPKKLQERMSMSNVALGAVARMSVLGLVPTAAETGYYFGSGGHTLFKSGTGNTDNRNAFITPSMTQAMHMATGAKLVGSAVNPWSTGTATKQEVSDGMKGFVPNALVIRNLIDLTSDQFPKSEPTQPK